MDFLFMFNLFQVLSEKAIISIIILPNQLI